jgi:hypothetical protein
MVPGSQTWKGNWADFVMTVKTSTSVIPVTASISHQAPLPHTGLAGMSFII